MHYAKFRELGLQRSWYTNIVCSRPNMVLTLRKLGIRQCKAVQIDLVSTPQLWCNRAVVIQVIFKGSALVYQATLKVEPPLMQLVCWPLCRGTINSLRRPATRPELYIHAQWQAWTVQRSTSLQQQNQAEPFSRSEHVIRKRGKYVIAESLKGYRAHTQVNILNTSLAGVI